MKFANLVSVILVAIFSFAMSSAHAGICRYDAEIGGCTEKPAHADLCRLDNVGDKCVTLQSETVKNLGCAIVNSVEVCSAEKIYNMPPVYNYRTQPPLQIISIGYTPVVVDARLADRARDYINETCPKYWNTSAATTFIAEMGAPQFNGFSVEGQMFLSACNAR